MIGTATRDGGGVKRRREIELVETIFNPRKRVKLSWRQEGGWEMRRTNLLPPGRTKIGWKKPDLIRPADSLERRGWNIWRWIWDWNPLKRSRQSRVKKTVLGRRRSHSPNSPESLGEGGRPQPQPPPPEPLQQPLPQPKPRNSMWLLGSERGPNCVGERKDTQEQPKPAPRKGRVDDNHVGPEGQMDQQPQPKPQPHPRTSLVGRHGHITCTTTSSQQPQPRPDV